MMPPAQSERPPAKSCGRRLILAAHGAGDESPANRRVEDLAHSLRSLWPGPVDVAFQRGAPGYADVEADAKTIVVPLFAAEGYYARRLLPNALLSQRGLGSKDPPPIILPAVGTHDDLVTAVLEQLTDVVPSVEHVVLAVHGTRRDTRSGGTADELRRAISRRWPESRVSIGYLDQEPRLETVLRRAGNSLCVVPWMWGAAGHAEDDLPEALAAAGQQGARVLPAIHGSDALDRIVLATAEEAARRFPLRLGARDSALSQAQTRLVQQRLDGAGCPTELTVRRERGDLVLDRTIAALGAGAFTEGLESALLAGEIDVAVHSLKDLPLDRFAEPGDTNGSLEVAAILPRGAAGEVLISRRGSSLEDLPLGARVGTCSARRRLQLLSLRDDLEITPLRGAVDARVEQLLSGAYDAIVLAEAGVARLGLEGVIAERLEDLLPDPGQGALAVQVRADDALARHLVARLDHGPTRRAVQAERSVQKRTPSGIVCAALATQRRGEVQLQARWLTAARIAEARATAANPTDAVDEVLGLLRAEWGGIRLSTERTS